MAQEHLDMVVDVNMEELLDDLLTDTNNEAKSETPNAEHNEAKSERPGTEQQLYDVLSESDIDKLAVAIADKQLYDVLSQREIDNELALIAVDQLYDELSDTDIYALGRDIPSDSTVMVLGQANPSLGQTVIRSFLNEPTARVAEHRFPFRDTSARIQLSARLSATSNGDFVYFLVNANDTLMVRHREEFYLLFSLDDRASDALPQTTSYMTRCGVSFSEFSDGQEEKNHSADKPTMNQDADSHLQQMMQIKIQGLEYQLEFKDSTLQSKRALIRQMEAEDRERTRLYREHINASTARHKSQLERLTAKWKELFTRRIEKRKEEMKQEMHKQEQIYKQKAERAAAHHKEIEENLKNRIEMLVKELRDARDASHKDERELNAQFNEYIRECTGRDTQRIKGDIQTIARFHQRIGDLNQTITRLQRRILSLEMKLVREQAKK